MRQLVFYGGNPWLIQVGSLLLPCADEAALSCLVLTRGIVVCCSPSDRLQGCEGMHTLSRVSGYVGPGRDELVHDDLMFAVVMYGCTDCANIPSE